VDKLVHAFRTRTATKADRAQVANRRPIGKLVDGSIHDGLRQHDLPAMGSRHDARRAVDRIAKKVPVATFHVARMEAAPHR
jgi:hypothetical protein